MIFQNSINTYIFFGVGYGIGRSYNWLSKTNDESYTKINDKIVLVSHPHTFTSKLLYTFGNTFMSQFFWPFFMLSDLNCYQKIKFGVRDIRPPFPFDKLKWKD
jgi:hypothetical protein